MLFGCSIVVVVFVSLGRCSTVSHRLSPSPPPYRCESCAQGTRRILRRGYRLKLESKYLSSIMLRRSCIGSKGLISLEQCSTVPRCPHLPLRVLGAGY
ncbi:hypothetical protein HBI48_132690 [Parastagonospora nodorum]|nr:hypothetical protein HBI48_132690 [Parastagonospora nodorum]